MKNIKKNNDRLIPVPFFREKRFPIVKSTTSMMK